MTETRREFVDRFLKYVGEYGDTQARENAELLFWNVLLEIWLAHPWRQLLMPDPVQITTVAGTRTYILPTFFGRVGSRDGVVRNLTTGEKIAPTTGEEIYETYPEAGTVVDTARGNPTAYAIGGTVGVAAQPSAAGQALQALSSDINDTDVIVTLEGTNNTGQWDVTQVTLNGTTPVALGTWKAPIQSFAKAFPQSVTTLPAGVTPYCSSRGTVTLRVVGPGATLQTLLPQESAREQLQITFWRTPLLVHVIGIPTIRLPHRLFRDADVIPALWSPAMFEKMQIEWDVNTGELKRAQAGAVPRPAFVDLVSFDNEQRAGNRRRTVPFGAG